MKQRHRTIGVAERTEIARLFFEEHWTYKQICAKYDKDRSTIIYHLKISVGVGVPDQNVVNRKFQSRPPKPPPFPPPKEYEDYIQDYLTRIGSTETPRQYIQRSRRSMGVAVSAEWIAQLSS
jgi:hypothetical protein